ncbi:MAG: aminotransferase class I/II-fold pyridoxal phosphate-dependent enzyme [Acidimicrobiales bacterium]
MSRIDFFGQMNTLAAELGAINLGHGYADDPPLSMMVDAATMAMAGGENQYSPSAGQQTLRAELARRLAARGLAYDPDDEITVTAGCTEALAAAALAHAPPGSEVLTLEPFYDSYPLLAQLAGAKLVSVPVRGLGGGDASGATHEPDLPALRASISPATRVLLLNSPHNPTGLCLSRPAAEAVATLAIENDLVVLSDEVYEELVYDGDHVPVATLDGMRGRTIVCSSVTKTLSVSGWRVGWACAPAHLMEPLRTVHQGLSYCAPTPLQQGAAVALRWGDDSGYFDQLRADYRARRDLLVDGLRSAGLDVSPPPAGYFVVADVSPWSDGADVEAFALRLAHEAGVVALPLSPFVSCAAMADHMMRFAFCKAPGVLREAGQRLERFANSRA